MRLRAVFSLPILVLAVAPTQLSARVEPNSPAITQTQSDTAGLPNENSLLRDGAMLKPNLLIAQASRTRRIRFARGASSATVEDAVVRGTRDIYLLGARRGQTMTVNITAPENNAVFEIKTPNGVTILQEGTSWNGVLSVTGDYRVIVGGTRGNATYRMNVSIQ